MLPAGYTSLVISDTEARWRMWLVSVKAEEAAVLQIDLTISLMRKLGAEWYWPSNFGYVSVAEFSCPSRMSVPLDSYLTGRG